MTGEGEIVGDLAQLAMLARAAEPGHGEGGDDGHTHEAACLNCGTALVGRHCHACGQAAHVHRTLGAFFHDLLHGVFHFEGKIWRTLPLLAWKPGQLTREYIDGRRASYVSPIALFLFCVFLMFAAISQFATLGNVAEVNVRGDVVQGVKENEAEIARLKAQRDKLAEAGQSTAELDETIKDRSDALDMLKELRSEVAPTRGSVKSDIPVVAHLIDRFRANPGLMIYKLQSSAYKYSWALIPLSVPFVWLLFPLRRRFHLYDHTVFVTYSLCFMTLLVVVVTLGWAAGLPGMAALITLIPPIHMYRQLRGTYGVGKFGAAWRTLALLFFASMAMTLYALAIVAQAGA